MSVKAIAEAMLCQRHGGSAITSQGCPACCRESLDSEPAGRKAQRITFLERKRQVTIEDLKVKTEGEDWHGCADAAMDLRDIDSELDGLRF